MLRTKSPCIGTCSATALGDKVCIGCKRTFEEVRDWNTYDDAQKHLINERVAITHGDNNAKV